MKFTTTAALLIASFATLGVANAGLISTQKFTPSAAAESNAGHEIRWRGHGRRGGRQCAGGPV